VSDTTLLAALALMRDRIQAISQAGGYFHNLGDSVYVEGLAPVPVDDAGIPFAGSVVIDPGDSSATPGSGEIRASAARVEAIFERTVSVIVAWPLETKAAWLVTEQQIGADLRRSLLANMSAYHAISVQRIAQTGQESSWPADGSGVLVVKNDFALRYIER